MGKHAPKGLNETIASNYLILIYFSAWIGPHAQSYTYFDVRQHQRTSKSTYFLHRKLLKTSGYQR